MLKKIPPKNIRNKPVQLKKAHTKVRNYYNFYLNRTAIFLSLNQDNLGKIFSFKLSINQKIKFQKKNILKNITNFLFTQSNMIEMKILY